MSTPWSLRRGCDVASKILNFLRDLSLRFLFSDEGEQLWVWQYETEDGKHDLFMDVGEEIRSVRKLKRALFTSTAISTMA